ncbi:hypothetical protein BC835DRAFT_1309444 [Cytidiella melzeri]|nr:hypothetical protein BC835DRAFT_1309444 [Cytidiella melzeri]
MVEIEGMYTQSGVRQGRRHRLLRTYPRYAVLAQGLLGILATRSLPPAQDSNIDLKSSTFHYKDGSASRSRSQTVSSHALLIKLSDELVIECIFATPACFRNANKTFVNEMVTITISTAMHGGTRDFPFCFLHPMLTFQVVANLPEKFIPETKLIKGSTTQQAEHRSCDEDEAARCLSGIWVLLPDTFHRLIIQWQDANLE